MYDDKGTTYQLLGRYGSKRLGNGKVFVVKYDPKQMQAKVEKIKLEDEEDLRVQTNWGDNIHRINFEVITPKLKDTFMLEVKKK